MPRQPIPGDDAAVRSPSGAAARAPAPSPSPLPSQRYRALRARYNALLVTLYERSPLTLREIAALAGCSKRAVQMLARVLGCHPRNARKCRPGTSVGARRTGEKPPPLNAAAARRVAAMFADVARELAASADAHAADELQRATARAKRRAARTQTRVMASAARQLGHLAAVLENTAAARDGIAAGGTRRSRGEQAARARKPRSYAERWDPHQLMREREACIHEAHAAARRAKAASAAAALPAAEADADRRIDAIAEEFYAGPRRGPRIRGL